MLTELIGNSSAMVALREEIGRLLTRQAGGRSLPPILIQGETGTGKGLLAAAIHRAGSRRDGPFVAVNCAAIPDTLLEAELFGYARGAFTDARQAKPGLVETAHRGTLFLDEIGLLPELLQGKLLTVLEERAVRRLGRTWSQPVDIAILAATSEDLQRSVRDRPFSEALYHRLSVLTLRLPPLREREGDVLLLAEHWLARAAADYSVIPKSLTPQARAALLAYPWPGNVRELRNRMERVILLAEPGLVTPDMLGLPDAPPAQLRHAEPSADAPRLRERIGSVERETLVAALTATGWNLTRAAARLGVPPTTLRYRLRKHGLLDEARPGANPPDPGEPATRVGVFPVGAAEPAAIREFAVPPLTAPNDQDQPDKPPSSPRPSPEAGRRQLTVMACGLLYFAAAAAAIEPDDLDDLMREAREGCAEVIARFEGHVAQDLGQGLLVYFGHPVAHEDDARRAVLAARLGIHTDLVVVGEVGSGDKRGHVALGETPHVAVQLERIAEPDAVAISPTTHRLIEGYFACKALGLHILPGVSQPLPIYRVLQQDAARSRFEVAVMKGLTPLVGRQQEVGLLVERWAQAKEGLGQVVLLSGEAGIGKSRLVQVLEERIAGEPHTAQTYQCSPYHQNSALYPVIDTLQRRLQFTREDSAQEKVSKLEAALEECGFSLDEAVPLFASLLSLPLSERYPLLTVAPQRQKEKTLDVLLAWLLKETERQATLSVWEDLQWIDPSTLELLGLVLEEAPTVRLLIVLTARPDFAPPWTIRSHLTQIALSRLSHRQAEVMVEEVVGGRAVPGALLQQVAAQTDGNPLFVEELTKMVLESGLLERVVGPHEPTGLLAPLAIPSTLHASLMARLDRLGPGKAVAQLGAALGREFPYELIQAVSPMDEVTLQRELVRLVEVELLYRRGMPPQARYVFKHALIQEAAYQSLLKSTKRQYHGQIAQVLERRFPETVAMHPEVVAHHYTEAGLTREAVVYWQRAGQRAIERSASAEAIGHLSQGLALIETVSETPERVRQELTLQLSLGAALLMVKDYRALEVETVYARARELRVHVGDSPQLFLALFGLWRFHMSRAELETAHELGQECAALAHRLHDPVFLVQAHFALGVTSFNLGEFASALSDFEQGIALYDPQRDALLAVLHGADPGVACRCYAARALWFLGYPDQALALSQEALTLARQSSDRYTLGYALHFACRLHTHRRDIPAVQVLAAAAIALANEHGVERWMGSGLMMRGWGLAEQGSPEEGIAQLRQGLAAWQAQLGRSHFLALLAGAHGTAGQFEAGLSVLDEALAVAQGTAERYYEAELHRLKGELLLQQDAGGRGPSEGAGATREAPRDVEPDVCFRRAIEIARRRGAKSLELRAVMSLSRLWQRQGKRTQAHQILGETYGWFREGFDSPDLREARALLDELGDGPT